jgi:23S rRNA (uracil1939-C5)-methyltransferase
VRILRPSPDRVKPACPHAGVCGGCDFLHAASAAQPRLHLDMLADLFRRAGGRTLPPGTAIDSGNPWHYRNRARIARVETRGGPLCGFREREGRRVVDIDACPILHPALSEIFGTLRDRDSELAQAISGSFNQIERFVAGRDAAQHRDGIEEIPLFAGDAHPGPNVDSAQRAAANPNSAQDFAHSAPNSAQRLPFTADLPAFDSVAIGPDAPCRLRVLDRTFLFDTRTFFQSNAEMAARLVQWLLADRTGAKAIDLFSGVGFFAAFLESRYKQVWAVERDEACLRWARRNLAPTTKFLNLPAEDFDLPPEARDPDLVIVDPPREGLPPGVAEAIAAWRPAELCYVSCNPATFVRDLRLLEAAGYQLTELRGFLFYPQTSHLELAARFKPTSQNPSPLARQNPPPAPVPPG